LSAGTSRSQIVDIGQSKLNGFKGLFIVGIARVRVHAKPKKLLRSHSHTTAPLYGATTSVSGTLLLLLSCSFILLSLCLSIDVHSAIKTIKDHLRNDLKLSANQTNPELISHLWQCIAHNTYFLQFEDGLGKGK
jgi:hypothetical protein